MNDALTLFFFNIVVYSIPLLYGTVGEILTEKSGSLNLGVEGIMAVGAVAGYLVGCMADSLLVGILAAFLVSGLCGLLFAFLTVTLQANQNVTGLAITTFGVALYFVLGNGIGTQWPKLSAHPELVKAIQPLNFGVLSDIPFLGKFLFSHTPLVYLGVAIAILVGLYLKFTKSGLRLRAVGENPAAADAVGVNVTLKKYLAISIGAGIMGIGGYYMGLNLSGSFEGASSWINGYGWISIALVIFANWSPFFAILGTFVFGFFTTLRISSGSLAFAYPEAFSWLTAIPAHLYDALPFIITALVLILSSILRKRKSGAPAAIGLPYYREDR